MRTSRERRTAEKPKRKRDVGQRKGPRKCHQRFKMKENLIIQKRRKVKGKRTIGLEKVSKFPNINIFGAGISKKENGFVVNGGRVFHLMGEGITLSQARLRVYGAISMISIEGNNLHYRTDIGWRDLEREDS